MNHDGMADKVMACNKALISLAGGKSGPNRFNLAVAKATPCRKASRQSSPACRAASRPAICASPALLGSLGLLQDKNATCYPGFEQHLTGARLQAGQAVVVDGLITTGRGPGLTLDFALALVEQLAGPARRSEVAQALLLAH